jgi:hypothetical protein
MSRALHSRGAWRHPWPRSARAVRGHRHPQAAHGQAMMGPHAAEAPQRRLREFFACLRLTYFHSSHCTGSPTAIGPSSSTSAKAPPAQAADIACCRPGHASAMRSQGRVAPRIRRRHPPMLRMRRRLLTRRIPLSSRFARRVEGGRVAPTCAIRACHTSCSRSVTCRRPP